jgi:pimeloyl-ACP methyl ester carboxylesterase
MKKSDRILTMPNLQRASRSSIVHQWVLACALLLSFFAGPTSANPNISTPTFPKSRLWHAPVEIEDGWKLQQHRVTGHWRLLDDANIRRAWGTRQHCRSVFDRKYGDLDEYERQQAQATPEPNLPLPTLGGMQFWLDYRMRRDWRLQKNILTGHWRLLDPLGIRHAWGKQAAVEAVWEKRVEPKIAAQPTPDMVVIFLHGILLSQDSWFIMRRHLEQEAEARGIDLEFATVNYPSTQFTNEESASGIASLVSHLPPEVPLSFVCHSMGGILALTYFKQREHPLDEAPNRIERIFFLGTPLGGAHMADLLQDFWIYEMVFGPAGQQLRTVEVEVEPRELPANIETIAIAGSKPPDGFSPFIPGDDDGTVEIGSVLENDADFKYTVPYLHSFMKHGTETLNIVKRHLFGEMVEVDDLNEAAPPAATDK